MYKLESLDIKRILSFKDQHFEFRNGKAVLIIGRNLTNPSQKGNGSGKSSFIESVAIAFTGTSIRDVKTKELVHRGESDGEVTITLFNPVHNKRFKIWRKIYTGSKSAEYKSWINDIEQSDRYSDFNTFNDFVWLTLGISKEDFFSFYLLTGDYKPFLLAGDTLKKAIINRFSGADKVDLALPYIEIDSETIKEQVTVIEKELLQNQTRQEVLTEQLVAEEEKVSDEKINEQVTAKQREIAELQLDIAVDYAIQEAKETLEAKKFEIENFEFSKDAQLHSFNLTIDIAEAQLTVFDDGTDEKLQPFKDELEISELEVESFEFTKDYHAEFYSIRTEKSEFDIKISEKKHELPKVKDQFLGEIGAIQNEEIELKDGLVVAEEELEANEKFESEVTKQLHDSITCPKCSHVFNLKDKTFNAEEAKVKLPEVRTTILEYKELISQLKNFINVDIQAKKEAVNKKVQEAGESIRSEIGALNEKLITLGADELKLKQEQQVELENKRVFEDAVFAAKRNLKNKETEIADDRKSLVNKVTNAKTDLKNKEQELANQLQSLQNQLRKAELYLKQQEEEKAAIQVKIENLQKSIIEIQNQEPDKVKLKSLEDQIGKLLIAEEEIKERLEAKRKEKERVDAWEINFKNFKSHLANKSIKNIQDYTNLFLNGMGSDISISIDGYRTLASKKLKEAITTTVLRDGFEEGSYGSFSGGERGRIDVSNVLGMQELINNTSPTGGMDFLLIDECLDQVEPFGLESIINSLQPLGKTVMIITQQTEINMPAEHTLVIQKVNKVSSILN
jgi:DNA repair exonuclease SbcCD ATPase subunit